ncbi:hypothetical protein HBH55_190260 [Parastagonospora nodorum]|nr:hypothetical protein HBH55_190260 [Parastagonospora nodorum]KAH5655425.1 hypothetical protein HBI51_048200 [Parastagonospora nodorum]KAH6416064.1 hypothetical protein HBI14_115080 [Parastagonospora nodorum]
MNVWLDSINCCHMPRATYVQLHGMDIGSRCRHQLSLFCRQVNYLSPQSQLLHESDLLLFPLNRNHSSKYSDPTRLQV